VSWVLSCFLSRDRVLFKICLNQRTLNQDCDRKEQNWDMYSDAMFCLESNGSSFPGRSSHARGMSISNDVEETTYRRLQIGFRVRIRDCRFCFIVPERCFLAGDTWSPFPSLEAPFWRIRFECNYCKSLNEGPPLAQILELAMRSVQWSLGR
jgi:hypothetical protein